MDTVVLRGLTMYPACKLDVLGHHRHPSCMDRTEVPVLKHRDRIGLTGLLQGLKGVGCEPQLFIPVVHFPCYLTAQAVEGALAKKEVEAALVLSYVLERT